MPEPLPDTNRDHQCYHYQAPAGQRCGSPAMKGEYYCYHHLLKTNYKKDRRILIDPEVTRMEIPTIEDRASIFVALAAVLHRLAENTIDTRRAGQMIYGLQVAMRALDPPPAYRSRSSAAANTAANPGGPVSSPLHRDGPGVANRTPGPAPATPCQHPATQPATCDSHPPTPVTIPITKESLLYFLRSRHCYNCNAELFPASQLTERPNPGAPPEVIEEASPALPGPQPATANLQPPTVLPTLHAVAENRSSASHRQTKARVPHPSQFHREGWDVNRRHPLTAPLVRYNTSRPHPEASNLSKSTFNASFALHSPRRSVSLRLVHTARHISAPRSTAVAKNLDPIR